MSSQAALFFCHLLSLLSGTGTNPPEYFTMSLTPSPTQSRGHNNTTRTEESPPANSCLLSRGPCLPVVSRREIVTQSHLKVVVETQTLNKLAPYL